MSAQQAASWRLSLAGMAITILIVIADCFILGWPLTPFTWCFVLATAASGALLGLANGGRILFALGLLTSIYLATPLTFAGFPVVQVDTLFDDARGGWGWQITPGLRFGRPNPNTASLEAQIGPIPPRWQVASPLSPYIRDGNERVQRYNLIQSKHLTSVLGMLPHDAARRDVARALTDTENLLRVHQSLLLACLDDLGYPPGTTAEVWWAAHQQIFRSKYNAVAAASLTRDWLERVEEMYNGRSPSDLVQRSLRAAAYQERGVWGGHSSFGNAAFLIRNGDASLDEASLALARQMVWWPRQGKDPQPH